MSLMLLDTASLYFRAYYGVPDNLRSPDGQPVNAVRGLLDTIAWLVTEHHPDRMVACWDDDWRPAFRVAAIPTYKAHRVAVPGDGTSPDVEQVPDALTAQIPVIVDVLAAIGIARVGAPGFEADDVIGTLTAHEVASAGDVDIVTGDRDLFQLVDDEAGVRVLYPARGVRNADVVDLDYLRERYGVHSGAAYADLALLRGDPSDGLPGVPGIGEKTAAKLLERFGDLVGLLRARDSGDSELTATQRLRLEAADDYLRAALPVVHVSRHAPVGEFDDRLPTAPRDPEALDALAERWGLRSSVDRVLAALAARTAG